MSSSNFAARYFLISGSVDTNRPESWINFQKLSVVARSMVEQTSVNLTVSDAGARPDNDQSLLCVVLQWRGDRTLGNGADFPKFVLRPRVDADEYLLFDAGTCSNWPQPKLLL
jgi:hypothetical protein